MPLVLHFHQRGVGVLRIYCFIAEIGPDRGGVNDAARTPFSPAGGRGVADLLLYCGGICCCCCCCICSCMIWRRCRFCCMRVLSSRLFGDGAGVIAPGPSASGLSGGGGFGEGGIVGAASISGGPISSSSGGVELT